MTFRRVLTILKPEWDSLLFAVFWTSVMFGVAAGFIIIGKFAS